MQIFWIVLFYFLVIIKLRILSHKANHISLCPFFQHMCKSTNKTKLVLLRRNLMSNHWTKQSKTSVYCMSHLFCIVGCSISQLAISKSLYAWASAESKRNKCLSSQRALTAAISITPVDQRHMTSAGRTTNVFWNQMFLDVNWWIWPVCYLGQSLSADSPSVLFS